MAAHLVQKLDRFSRDSQIGPKQGQGDMPTTPPTPSGPFRPSPFDPLPQELLDLIIEKTIATRPSQGYTVNFRYIKSWRFLCHKFAESIARVMFREFQLPLCSRTRRHLSNISCSETIKYYLRKLVVTQPMPGTWFVKNPILPVLPFVTSLTILYVNSSDSIGLDVCNHQTLPALKELTICAESVALISRGLSETQQGEAPTAGWVTTIPKLHRIRIARDDLRIQRRLNADSAGLYKNELAIVISHLRSVKALSFYALPIQLEIPVVGTLHELDISDVTMHGNHLLALLEHHAPQLESFKLINTKLESGTFCDISSFIMNQMPNLRALALHGCGHTAANASAPVDLRLDAFAPRQLIPWVPIRPILMMKEHKALWDLSLWFMRRRGSFVGDQDKEDLWWRNRNRDYSNSWRNLDRRPAVGATEENT